MEVWGESTGIGYLWIVEGWIPTDGGFDDGKIEPSQTGAESTRAAEKTDQSWMPVARSPGIDGVTPIHTW